MSVLEIISREVKRASLTARLVWVVLPVVGALTLVTAGAILLARGRWLTLSPLTPFLIWAGALGCGVLTWLFVRRRFAERASVRNVARAIEDEQGLRRGSLSGLIEVAPQGGTFVERAANSLGESISIAASSPAPVHRRGLQRAALVSALVLLQVLFLATASWGTRSDGWRALLSPVDAWRGTLLPELRVVDLPGRIQRGSVLDITVAAEGREYVVVRWRTTGAQWRDSSVAVDESAAARLRIAEIDADLTLLASDGRVESDVYHVQVVERPFVGDVVIEARYPAYLQRAPEQLTADHGVRIPAGTRLRFSGISSEPLRSVQLRSGQGALNFTVEGSSFNGEITPRASALWGWEAEGEREAIADLPPALHIDVYHDSLPHVEILSPTGEVLIGTEGEVEIDIHARDDNALRGVSLLREVISEDGSITSAHERPVTATIESSWLGSAVVELGELNLSPGRSVRVTALAHDAAPGDRRAVSKPLILRVPTASEERQAAREAGEAAVAAATAAALAQKELARETEIESRTRTDRNEGAEMRHESAERARDLAQQQKGLQDRVTDLEDAAHAMEERLRRAGALDSSLASQLHEAQRLLREAITDGMSDALQNVEGAAGNLDGQRTRQSLAELARQQERLRDALERSAEMLRRAALEGAMQTLGDEARELAAEQRSFADSARQTPPDTGLARQLAERTRDIGESMDALRDRLEREQAHTGAMESERAGSDAERAESALRESIRRSAEASSAISANERTRAEGAASDAASQAADAMENAAESIQRARDGQVSEWKGELNDALDRSVQEMMQLAREQESLANDARANPNDASLRARQSALQQGVQTAQQRLEEESRKSALVSGHTQQLMEQARQRVTQATATATQQGQQGQQQRAMQEAANTLRDAAAQLTRDRERSAAAQSASGVPEMLQQMQQLAQDQGTLNQQMQGLWPQMQRSNAQGTDGESRTQARELARSQREVARRLDELADSDRSGRTQELAREARLLAQAIDQGAIDPATQARQERLFRRMLDAGQSLEQEQEDESQRRQSRAARGILMFTPPGGSTRGRDAVRYAVPAWEELRTLTADERRMVIEYFRRLNSAAEPVQATNPPQGSPP